MRCLGPVCVVAAGKAKRVRVLAEPRLRPWRFGCAQVWVAVSVTLARGPAGCVSADGLHPLWQIAVLVARRWRRTALVWP